MAASWNDVKHKLRLARSRQFLQRFDDNEAFYSLVVFLGGKQFNLDPMRRLNRKDMTWFWIGGLSDTVVTRIVAFEVTSPHGVSFERRGTKKRSKSFSGEIEVRPEKTNIGKLNQPIVGNCRLHLPKSVAKLTNLTVSTMLTAFRSEFSPLLTILNKKLDLTLEI